MSLVALEFYLDWTVVGDTGLKELAQKCFSLDVVEDKLQAGGVKEGDPSVTDAYANAWDELNGNKDELVNKFGLDPTEWTEPMDKDKFMTKFT